MEEEEPINFKALRAKFQEEALLAQSKSRPAVAEKPKHLPPPVGHCSAVVSSINTAVENKAPVAPRVVLRDGLQASGARRPISFPPHPQQFSPTFQLANRGTPTQQSLKDRHMPLVLPVLPVKVQKTELQAKKEHKLHPEPGKQVKPQTKAKKKGLVLPFTSAKAPKVTVENRKEPTYAELTARPSSAPGELPSVESKKRDDGASFQGDQSTAESRLSSPDISITPPSTDTSFESNNKIATTLERAKKKFSCRQMLISAKHKSLRSPDCAAKDKALPLPPRNIEIVQPKPPIPPPMCLPHLACVSARPLSKAKNSLRKAALDKQFEKDEAEIPSGEPLPPPAPPKRRLPDLRLLGPVPPKPPRPPSVDLRCYHLPAVKDDSPGSSQAPSEEPESEHPSSVLGAPDFPDFEISEMGTAESEAVDIGALGLEALDLVSTDLPVPEDSGDSDFEDPPLDLLAYDRSEPFIMSTANRDLNVGSQKVKPLNPSGFPEPINLSEFPEPAAPEQGCENMSINPVSNSQAAETDWVASKPTAQEREIGNPTALDEQIQPHPSGHEQNSCPEPCENVYEDVENMNRFILGQISHKHNEDQKNPYAHSLPMKEEACLNIWPPNPWGSASEDQAHSSHTHVLSKDCQSPNTADHKEQRKREKQRLEKEKKEQKEREKKENEMKKKFKVTGNEEPMYHATVMVASKVRKNDLPVKSGETVSIIRTTSCPKGKWLARNADRKYGYISVMNVELDIKEMLELGKRAQAAGRGGNVEGDTVSIGSRSSSHPVQTSSFTDDSEEWAFEDETLSPSNECPSFLQQTASVPETSSGHAGAQHTLSDVNLEDLHTQHEAIQKLAIFFQHGKPDSDDIPGSAAATPTNAEPPHACSVEEPPYPEQEVDFTELELLPPPPLYADTS